MTKQTSTHGTDLASLLRAAVPGLKLDVSETIAQAFPRGSIRRATVADLTALGASAQQAARIVAIFHLARYVDASAKAGPETGTPSDLVAVLTAMLGHREQENFVVVLLNSRMRIMTVTTAGVGTLAEVSVHPRDIFRDAIRLGAASVVLAHNHPSGDAEPSEADIELTVRMATAGALLGIPVIDHLVIAGEEWSSLRALGLL